MVRIALVTAVAASLAACGGHSKPRDSYASATNSQQVCCENLAGGDRDACLREIVRVEDPVVARSSANQETYACVVEHFQCDSSTGRATADSAQAQLDCIQDLN